MKGFEWATFFSHFVRICEGSQTIALCHFVSLHSIDANSSTATIVTASPIFIASKRKWYAAHGASAVEFGLIFGAVDVEGDSGCFEIEPNGDDVAGAVLLFNLETAAEQSMCVCVCVSSNPKFQKYFRSKLVSRNISLLFASSKTHPI